MSTSDSDGDIWALTATHWGAYEVNRDNLSVRPVSIDPDPSPIGLGLGEAIDHPLRIRMPMIREGYLKGQGRRGDGAFVATPWDEALDIAANALKSVRDAYGNEAIYGGSYGWGSAGRFHHPQSQIHRFLNCIGGYVFSKNSYSTAAMEVIVPHVLCRVDQLFLSMPTWAEIAEHGELVLAFGGMALKNAQVNPGGVGRHTGAAEQIACKEAGIRFVNVSPLKDDAQDALDAEWVAARPNSDVALMLALAHTLLDENLHDQKFLDACCTGFDRFADYLRGTGDGQPKSADWAAPLCRVPADKIRNLAREIASRRTLITVSWSVQRAQYGEQPYWAAIALSAMSGSFGKDGGGFGAGYGAVHSVGANARMIPIAPFPQGENPIEAFIPVARISDMLLNPGAQFSYNGKDYTYPDIKLAYWCGGNPFHHHQDLGRLVKAWRQPDTVIAHEPWWNSLARHADIVFPCTTPLERNDIAAGMKDMSLFAMKQARAPFEEARNDYDIFADLAARLGCADAFTEGKTDMEWIKDIYAKSCAMSEQAGVKLPAFETLWSEGAFTFPPPEGSYSLFKAFRQDPAATPLPTPSGRIELWSDEIASFGYADCPGHPAWRAPDEWLGAPRAETYPFHLISNQPKTRLHSQYDHVGASAASKIKGREPAIINRSDAAARNIADGDLIRLYNDRGACLAAAQVSDDVMPGVVVLATGAWYDPEKPSAERPFCLHGNPNVLTRDIGTSSLAQGPTAHTCLINIERWADDAPALRLTQPPTIKSA
ncbi:MAG: molybdopterin-dependent oxidoreductase [Pseudomonadota bacterium]